MNILIKLPADRRKPGVLLIEGTDLMCHCLGRSDSAAATAVGNPTRDPLRQMGDTPLGGYDALPGSVLRPERSYGPHPVIILSPVSGDALKAAQAGRSGLLIHGGDPAADGVSLRPTHGCIRVADHDQQRLVEMIRAAGKATVEIAAA